MFHGGNVDCRFEGTEGRSINVSRNGISSTPASILTTPLTDRDFHLPNVGNSHKQNWLDCIRSLHRLVGRIEIAPRPGNQASNIGQPVAASADPDPCARNSVINAEANAANRRTRPGHRGTGDVGQTF